MKLYEIPNALRKALDDVCYNDETKTAAGLEEYQEVENDAKDKLENTAFYLCELEHEADALKAEQKRFADLIKSNKNKQEAIRKLMLEALQSMPDQKVKTAKVSMWIKKTTALEIDNEDTIPQEYFREKRSIELDKTKLKNDLEEGVSVQGACIKENQSIVIR